MDSVWFTSELAEEIMKNKDIFDQTQGIITDIITGRLDITIIVENMAGVLTAKDVDGRVNGMRFFTKLLQELPKDHLNEMQVQFISKFYTDRLKDNHRVIPAVLEGYVAIIDMKNYNIQNSAEFLTTMFREVSCQSQMRQDRYHIYLILQKLMDKDLDYMKKLGPDFVCGVIAAMDGERDPRNLLFLFAFLPHFVKKIPLGHLVEEMFEVISCYYPIDFYPSPDDPAAVSRQELATALTPCLCATPEFGEHCLILLIEKLDSSLRLAKIDSLKLLVESCNTFKPTSYIPFLKTLWSSINRELSHKTDEELKIAAHEALSALVKKLSSTAHTDLSFENFVKGILISQQTYIAEATTVSQFVQTARILLTVANASKESCLIITQSMIPAMITYYGFNSSPKLQIASLDFLGDLYNMGKHWNVLNQISAQVKEIPQVCLTAVSQPVKEYQMAGFKTLIQVKNALESDLVLPFVEVLIHNVQHSQDNDILSVSVETVHTIARKYPELIMNLVVKGTCDLENLTQDTHALEKRLNLLSNLASIDEFSKIIISEMLKVISSNDKDASKVVEALSESMSNTSLYTHEKVEQIESDHGLVDSILSWLISEIKTRSYEKLSYGFNLVANTVSSLPAEKQQKILEKHEQSVFQKCISEEIYFLVLECLYNSLHQNIYNDHFQEVMTLSLNLCLSSENEVIRTKACVLIAHYLNKAEYGQTFELLYELLKNYLSSCNRDENICPRLILLYGWLTKALIMRGSDLFSFWLQKIMVALSSPEYCKQAASAIQLIMIDSPDYLNTKQHCRFSFLYKQRMFQTFSTHSETFVSTEDDIKEAYLLCWAYILMKAPKTVLKNAVDKLTPLVIDSLDIDNTDLLLVMTGVLSEFVQSKHAMVADSLQTILPRLIKLSKYIKSMDVRIKSLQCLYDIANSYPTILLLPYKQEILMDMTPSLDDKKRLVRNAAVKARTRWYLIGSPGETKN